MYSLLLSLIYLSFVSLGLPDSLLGAGWPIMHSEFGVPISYMGMVTMIISTISNPDRDPITVIRRIERRQTNLNKIYLEKNKLTVEILGRGFAWLDTGTFESLLQAANFVQSMEINTGMKIASIEEVACRMGYISKEQLIELSKKYDDEKTYSFVNGVLNAVAEKCGKKNAK